MVPGPLGFLLERNVQFLAQKPGTAYTGEGLSLHQISTCIAVVLACDVGLEGLSPPQPLFLLWISAATSSQDQK